MRISDWSSDVCSSDLALSKERAELKTLLDDESLRWQAIAGEVQELKKQFGPKTALGKRRTTIGDAPVISDEAFEVLVEREPITVICSTKRSEERRGGKEGVSTGRSRLSPYQ